MNNIFVENVYLSRILSIIVLALEVYINKEFFVHAFDLKPSKRKCLIFYVTCFSLESLCILCLPYIVFSFINILITLACLIFFFRQNFIKSIFVLLTPVSIFQLLKLLLVFAVSYLSNITPIMLVRIPSILPLMAIPAYLCVFLLFEFFKKFNFTKYFSKDLSLTNKIVIALFCIFTLLIVFINVYMIYNLFTQLDFALLLSLVIFNIFLLVSVVMLTVRTTALQEARDIIDYEKKLNDTLSCSYDSVREFKHDFSNIMQSIGGYLYTDDLDGLKTYYSSIFKECEDLKKLSILNKDVLNSPPVLSLVTEKYYRAKELGLEFNIEVFIDFSNLHMDIYEFTRILGIFLDNSLEAASKSSKKLINIIISKDINNHFESIVIENSCPESNIDTVKIFDKNFSTKPKNSGIGLWKVKKILNKHDNISLNTSMNDDLFRHQMKIYY